MQAATSFPPGLPLEPHKASALSRPLQAAPRPATVVMALDQGNGIRLVPVVEAGAQVRQGSVLAVDPENAVPALHAPVAGAVVAVDANGAAGTSTSGGGLTIVSDGSAAAEPALPPIRDPATIEPDALLARIAAAGIVGLGGAAFSTAAKLAAARARPDVHLVLNGAECEPWICCDDALMRERASDVVLGARLLMRAAQAARCTIAVEDDKPEAVASLRAALADGPDAGIELRVLPALYPAGAERQLLAAVTGIEVPSGGLPVDVGLLCQNVGTAAAVAQHARTGEPCLRRIVTVTGGGVAAPANVDASIGTPIAELVALCGGYAGAPRRLIAGGTMTGRALGDDAAGLTKSINCIVVATDADLRPRGVEMPCIRCGDCARACPVGLLPQQLHRAAQLPDEAQLDRFGLADCIECGCCDYVCPSQIPLTQCFREARAHLSRRMAAARRADDARRRFEQHDRRLREAAESAQREFDAARRIARGTPDREHES